jgi:hypothetical protein
MYLLQSQYPRRHFCHKNIGKKLVICGLGTIDSPNDPKISTLPSELVIYRYRMQKQHQKTTTRYFYFCHKIVAPAGRKGKNTVGR